MDLSGKILFGLTLPRIAPVSGATVKIFKSDGPRPGIPVSPLSAVTDATGFFTLTQCDVTMRMGKDLKVHGADVTIPSGWINVPGSSFNLPAFPPVPNFDVGPVQVSNGKLTTDAIKVPDSPKRIKPPDFNHHFVIEVPTHLTIEVAASGEVFRQAYPLPLPPVSGAPAIAPPLIVLNRSQPLLPGILQRALPSEPDRSRQPAEALPLRLFHARGTQSQWTTVFPCSHNVVLPGPGERTPGSRRNLPGRNDSRIRPSHRHPVLSGLVDRQIGGAMRGSQPA